ncbi:hypothetical protein ACJ41O_004794 [Fusarium nematophilum]
MSGNVDRPPRPGVAEINAKQLFLRSFHFPDAHIALTFFNNDLVVPSSDRVNSDDGYRTDEEDSIEDEASVPSSHVSAFEIELNSLPPSLTSSATLLSPDEALLDQSGQQRGIREGPLFGTSLPEQGMPSRAPTPGLRRRSSAVLDEDDGGRMSPLALPAPVAKECEWRNHHRTLSGLLQTYEILPPEPPANPHFPAYIVHQVDSRSPVKVWELAEQSPQHKQEVKALEWDANFPFDSSHERDTVEYNTELADWRRRRFKYIYQEPTVQEKRRSAQIRSRVAEIAESRQNGGVRSGL